MSESCSALEPYALRVLGDSMAPEFWDGCIVIIDPAHAPQDQAYVIAEVAGEVILRQLVIDGERRLLRALNPAYPILEWQPSFRLRGAVMQRAGTRRSQRKHYD